MTRGKLLVILFYANILYASLQEYCKVCPYHILCKYPIEGPSISCIRYDKNKLLTQADIESILDKINDRRNFIALGLSKYLPGAANMKKLVWSDELANFAQRWVDQCDPTTRPDKEDDCRNLETTEVGQNIATMSDLSSEFNIKNFVDTWFMQSLYYSGSVSYYNQSDEKSKYFTQLIWANTEIVGCGQASFYAKTLNTIITRLVCNFAPKGNIHGKPVYAIGYPATQCSENLLPDSVYKGLCTYAFKNNAIKFTSLSSPVSSLLRIIDFSDSTDWHNNRTSNINIKSNRNSSMISNNTHAAVKRYPQQKFWEKSINISKPLEHYVRRGGKPVPVYHGYNSHNNLNLMNKNTELNTETYGALTPPITSYSNQNYRKYKQETSCTRRTASIQNEYENNNYKSDKCTREKDNDLSKSVTQSNKPWIVCPCESSTTTPPTSLTNYVYKINCQCLNENNPQIVCSNLRKTQVDVTSYDNKENGNYYDLLPNLNLRKETNRQKFPSTVSAHTQPNVDFGFVEPHRRRGHIQHHSLRQKRNDKQYATIKPFWQLDDTLDNKRLQLKAVRYTTLSNKIVKKTKQTTLTKSIEPITVNLVNIEHNNKPFPITEKYLSFNELMQLRKINLSGDYDARRKDNPANTTTTTSPTTTTTTEITTNTPFMRMKHCTRKLTCTWTVTKMTDINGSIIGENGDVNRGSRTPPGYVEGCTRTSTCTREYMDRNKSPFTKDHISEPNATSEIGDDDYCERRSLNIQRRNPQEGTTSSYNFMANLDAFMTSFPSASQKENMIKDKSSSDCLCYDVRERMKRDNNINSKIYQLKYFNNAVKKSKKNYNENISYGELYYKILERIRHMWDTNIIKHHQQKCFCKGSIMNQNIILMFLLILYITLMQ